MTDKEKKTIELLNKYTDRNFPCDSCKYCSERPNVNYSIKILLNLIEKQQKEIQRLIEIEKEHKKENGELRERINNEIENHKVLSLDIAQACVDLGLPEDTIIADELVLEINKKYISKDKIREKIEELKEFQNKFYELNMLKDVAIKTNEINLFEKLLQEGDK